MKTEPILALTQGDPAGIGPEILLTVAGEPELWTAARPLLVAERAALLALREVLPAAPWDRLAFLSPQDAGLSPETAGALPAPPAIPVIDPVGRDRRVTPGQPGLDDAVGSLAALDLALEWVQQGRASALVTAPVNKALIAEHVRPDFRGHTEYLAERCGLEAYGRDFLMAFLSERLRVVLLSTHLPLRRALDHIGPESILEALRCLDRHAPRLAGRRPKIAVAGVNPHAGEGGLLGEEDERDVRPAVLRARAEGLDVHGPESADSLFSRAAQGEFDWVLALYHDQGLIAVKTAAFGEATNWTLGLPVLRTSVDHGTAYGIAGRGVADAGSMRSVIQTTVGLLASRA